MENGFRCYRDRRCILVLLLLPVILLGWWWGHLPRTPKEYFQVRCANCHDLPSKELCKRSREERAGIVHAMRTLHGAAEVIDEEEALIITTYLKESFTCP